MKKSNKKFFVGKTIVRTIAANNYVEEMSQAMEPICNKMRKNGWTEWQISVAINHAASQRECFEQLKG